MLHQHRVTCTLERPMTRLMAKRRPQVNATDVLCCECWSSRHPAQTGHAAAHENLKGFWFMMTRSRVTSSHPQPLLLLQPCSPLLQQLVLCAAPLLSHLQPPSTLEVSCQCMQ